VGSPQQSEQQYRQLVEVAPIAIFIRREGKVAFANGRAAGLFRANTPADLVGTPILDLVHPDFRKLVARLLRLRGEWWNHSACF
jgi:PAS domain S-box-containing protein